MERSSHRNVDLTPVKGRGEEGGVGREALGLQSGSEKGLSRTVKCFQPCVAHWKNHALGRTGWHSCSCLT